MSRHSKVKVPVINPQVRKSVNLADSAVVGNRLPLGTLYAAATAAGLKWIPGACSLSQVSVRAINAGAKIGFSRMISYPWGCHGEGPAASTPAQLPKDRQIQSCNHLGPHALSSVYLIACNNQQLRRSLHSARTPARSAPQTQ